MGNSSSIDNESDKSSESEIHEQFDIFDENIMSSITLGEDEKNMEEKAESNLTILDDTKEVMNNLVDEIVKNTLDEKKKFNQNITINFSNNLNNLELKCKKTSFNLLKRNIIDNKESIEYHSGTLEYAFINSLYYTDIQFELNKNYIINSSLENIITLSENKISFVKLNTVDDIIKKLLKNKPVIFQYNIIDGIESSNWIIDDFGKNRNIINYRTGIIIGYDLEFKIFKVFDEIIKYFPFDIIRNNNIAYKIFSYEII
jgi:hypothetical protein